nr:hypothetical protein Itr_chr13CG13720 [Ipomoea trifida]
MARMVVERVCRRAKGTVINGGVAGALPDEELAEREERHGGIPSVKTEAIRESEVSRFWFALLRGKLKHSLLRFWFGNEKLKQMFD